MRKTLCGTINLAKYVRTKYQLSTHFICMRPYKSNQCKYCIGYYSSTQATKKGRDKNAVVLKVCDETFMYGRNLKTLFYI